MTWPFPTPGRHARAAAGAAVLHDDAPRAPVDAAAARAIARRGLARGLGDGAAYALAGGLGLMLAEPPGYASPLYPSAGIALAATLTFGRSPCRACCSAPSR